MDEQSKAALDGILAKDPADLTDPDKDFLRARRSYLTEAQADVYSEVLGDQPVPETDDEEPKARRGRKSAKE